MKRNSYLIIIFCFVFLLVACSAKDAPQTPKEPVAPAATAQRGGVESSGSVSVSSGSAMDSSELEKSVRVEVSPSSVKRRDTMQIKVTGAPEGSTIVYEWARNGVRLAESGNSMQIGDEFKRGDRVDCAVKVETPGRTAVWYVSGLIANSPPIFEGNPTVLRVQERAYKITIKASDPDGDTISYALKPPVDGASINSATGEVHYTAPADKKGSVSLTIAASDNNGGETFYTIGFEIQ